MDDLTKYIEGARRGNRKDLERLIELTRNDILRISIYLSNSHDGEDIAQEATLRIFKSIKTLKDPRNYRSWINRIVKNSYVDFMRSQKRSTQEPTDFSNRAVAERLSESMLEERRDFLPSYFAEDQEYINMVMDIIRTFSMRERECLYYFYYMDMSYKEIAEDMNISVKKVDHALDNARQRLRRQLEAEAPQSVLMAGVIPVGGVPVLSKIFEKATAPTPQMSDRLMAFARANLPEAAPVKTYTATASKVIAIGAAAVIATVGIAVGTMNTGKEQAPIVSEAPAVVAENETPEPTPTPTEKPIRTLADMIGDEPAAQLEGMTENGADIEEWRAFLDSIGAEGYETSTGMDGYIYNIYILEKQDKRLTLIDKYLDGGSDVELKYVFGPKSDPEPDMVGIILSF